MIDPVESVLTLLDRYKQYQQVKECDIIGQGKFGCLFVMLCCVSVAFFVLGSEFVKEILEYIFLPLIA